MSKSVKDWTRNDFLVFAAFLIAACKEIEAHGAGKFIGIPTIWFPLSRVKMELLLMTRTAIRPLTDKEIDDSISNIAFTEVNTSRGNEGFFPAIFLTPEEYLNIGGKIDQDDYQALTEYEKKEKRSIVQWGLLDTESHDVVMKELERTKIDGIKFDYEEGHLCFTIIPEPVTDEEIMENASWQ